MSTCSDFLLDHEAAIRKTKRLGPCLDLACGRGRQATVVAGWGLPVVGVDRNAEALRAVDGIRRTGQLPIALLRADLESAPHLPVAEGRFGCVLVFRYLHRPLASAITRALRPGGLLIYETFTIYQNNRSEGPNNPHFLLEPNELPDLFPGLDVEHHWEGDLEGDAMFAVAQLVARLP